MAHPGRPHGRRLAPLPRSAIRAEVSRTRVARLIVFAVPVASPFAEERGNLTPSPGTAEGADRIGGERDHPGRPAFDHPLKDRPGADLKFASYIRRDGHLAALGHACAHITSIYKLSGSAQADPDGAMGARGAAVS